MKISILGCGWLGFPLAKSLVDKGFLVKGSTTTQNKLSILSTNGILPYLISINENEIIGNCNAFLENSEMLILDIPPKLRGISSENFVSKIKNIIPYIENSSVKKIVFISSTSVYADSTSTALGVTENTKPQPETESGRQLLETENLLLTNLNFQTTIIRFGGLIGNDRHPIQFLAGRKNIENPNAPINLIHQKDCIGIIEAIIDNKLRLTQLDTKNENQIFNAVTPFHPSRKDYYTQKAIEMNLALPEFNVTKESVGKLVLSSNVQQILNYSFIENNL